MEDLMHADRLRRLVADIGLIDVDELLDDVSLLDQGAVDSTGLVELQLAIEEDLGRELSAEELDGTTLLTINGIMAWLDRTEHYDSTEG